MRAARFLTCKIPIPLMRTFDPFFIVLTIHVSHIIEE